MGSQIMLGSDLILALVPPLLDQLNQDFQQNNFLPNHPRFQYRQGFILLLCSSLGSFDCGGIVPPLK